MATHAQHRGFRSDKTVSRKGLKDRETVWRSVPNAPTNAPNQKRSSRAAKLEELENAFIDRIFDTHPNRERAMDRLLDDLNKNTNAPMARNAMPVASAEQLERIETLLVAASLDAHPNSAKAWDNLLDDVIGDAPTLPPEFYDRDWDGLA